MRIVLDTNVLLSGFALRGMCEALVDICFDSPDHRVITSQYILDEFLRHYTGKFKVPAADAAVAVQFIRDHAEVVEPAEVTEGRCDEDDLPILGTLVGAGADCLVTGDKNLLELGKFGGYPILSPRRLYERLK